VVRVVVAAGHTTTAQRRFTVAVKPADGTPPPPPPPAGSRVKNATVNTFWQLFGKRTRVATLTLDGAPAGAKVTVTCKGRQCAFKKLKLTSTGKRIKLAKRFKKRKLATRR
jgi:hypothetical protein